MQDLSNYASTIECDAPKRDDPFDRPYSRKGDRTRFIDEAVRHFVRGRQLRGLREGSKEGAQKTTARDLQMAGRRFR